MRGLRRKLAVAAIRLGAVGVIVIVAVEETVSQLFAEVLRAESGIGGVAAGVVAALALRPVLVRMDRRLRERSRDSGSVGAEAGVEIEDAGAD